MEGRGEPNLIEGNQITFTVINVILSLMANPAINTPQHISIDL